MSASRILIFANGVLPDLEAARRLLQPGDLVICADGGARHSRALGLTPQALIGDLDSIAEQDLAWHVAAGAAVEHHRHDKDETDLELALNYALTREPAAIVILGALGGRLDHTLGNIALLSDVRLVGRDCCLDDGIDRVVLCRDRALIKGAPGDIVSLVPWGGAAAGIRTDGLRWLLKGETLYPARTRGISNEMLATTAAVQVDSGQILIVHRRVTLTPA